MPDYKVLIVDDNEVCRMSVKRFLEVQNSVLVDEAGCAMKALDMLWAGAYDCVFLDYYLEEMTGVEFLAQIYDQDKEMLPVPVVMLTGQNNDKVVIEALRSGAIDYLRKDQVSPALLSITLMKAIEVYDLKKSRRRIEEELTQ